MLLSPRTRRPSGKPKELWIPSTGEVHVSVYMYLLLFMCVLVWELKDFFVNVEAKDCESIGELMWQMQVCGSK